MQRAKLATCIAGLIGLLGPLPALAQDEDQAEEVLAPDTADEVRSGAAPNPEPEVAADAGTDQTADADAAAETEDEDAADEFEYAGDDTDDPLYADDEFNDGDFEPIEDDVVAVETGRDQIPDVYELYDEDGDSSFDEDFDYDDDEVDLSGLFRDELPLIRKPSGSAVKPVARFYPAVPAGQAAAWPVRAKVPAVPNRYARKLPGLAYGFGAGSAWHQGGQPVAGGTAPLARPSVLSPFGGIYIPYQLGARASEVYMVNNNGAPFQAAVRWATSPKTWQPAAKYRALAGRQDWEVKHMCGGSLIDPEWVLTAAHCLWGFSDGVESRAEAAMAKGLSVLLGAEDISKPQSGTNYVVDRVIIHGGFNPRNIYRHDIALLHIVQKGAPSRLNVISSIRRYSDTEPKGGTKLSVMGWGKSRDEKTQLAQTALWRADVRMIDRVTCRSKRNFGDVRVNGQVIPKIGAASLCAGESPGKACSGDSGGPLIFTNGLATLLGIVSWTVEDSCGRPEIPNVYTSVASYKGWIDEAIGSEARPGTKVEYLTR